VLPDKPSVWAAWNYERRSPAGSNSHPDATAADAPSVCLHYLINKLQPLPTQQPVIVSLNPLQDIAPTHVHGVFDYAHPVFDQAAVRAQRELVGLQGQQNTWFCGAWTGYGFHEDGLKSGLQVARRLLIECSKAEGGGAA
jgi:predicted NAD/FAD-binding protein